MPIFRPLMDKKLIITADGSPSFHIAALKETYHSRHGARTESQYVYIDQGLHHWLQHQKNPKQCRIFEMGLGTGINALLTFEAQLHTSCSLVYHTLEKYPLTADEIEAIPMEGLTSSPAARQFFKDLHQLDWGLAQQLSSGFEVKKIQADLFEWVFENGYDLIYYDAFGAHAQPELWTEAALKPVCEALAPGGIWVSYCAKGSVRRALTALGLHVERLPGPPGKREMLRATKPE